MIAQRSMWFNHFYLLVSKKKTNVLLDVLQLLVLNIWIWIGDFFEFAGTEVGDVLHPDRRYLCEAETRWLVSLCYTSSFYFVAASENMTVDIT